MNQILHSPNNIDLGSGIIARMSFSHKPQEGYTDYYDKMTYYIGLINDQAKGIDHSATAIQYRAMKGDDASVFQYIDTNASRADITSIVERLKNQKVGIIGLGGTGSYILDFVAKTPVKEIHLFDGDVFYSHNAFRAPGAPTLDVLNSGMSKVEYLKSIYSNMHKGIIAYSMFMEDVHLEKLSDLDFVFVSIDEGSVKSMIYAYLESQDIPYVDVGLGVDIEENGKLGGLIRTTSITSPGRHNLKKGIDFSEAHDDAYNTNIQIAELNALNAAMAVISWKKHVGVYEDPYGLGETLLNIDTGLLIRREDEDPS